MAMPKLSKMVWIHIEITEGNMTNFIIALCLYLIAISFSLVSLIHSIVGIIQIRKE